MSQDYEYYVKAMTGLNIIEFESHCQYPILGYVPSPEKWRENVCWLDSVAYLRMPGTMPNQPLCMGHLITAFQQGWTYEWAVEQMAMQIEKAIPWEIEDDDIS